MRTLLVLALTALATLPPAPAAGHAAEHLEHPGRTERSGHPERSGHASRVGHAGRVARPPRFAWPLAPPHRVVRTFDPPAGAYAPGHRGVDLAAPPGTAVLAAADAVVLHAGPVVDRTVVSLLHTGGLRTTYEPVEIGVRRGQAVRRGDRIGTLLAGHAGCPTEACLHWGAIRTAPPPLRDYLDPLRLLANGRVRLLPGPATTQPGGPPRHRLHRPAGFSPHGPGPAAT